MKTKLETSRLLLKRATHEDLSFFKTFLGSVPLTRFLPKKRIYTQEEIEEYVQDRTKHWEKGYGTYIITLKDYPSEKIGYVGIEQIENTELDGLRGGIMTEYTGNGFVYESTLACIKEYFAEKRNEKIYAVFFQENIKSGKIIEKLDMQKEDDLKAYDLDGLLYYSIDYERFNKAWNEHCG
jgi:[ribosomal protein S5]-alanine N-acetyltransferase